MLSLPFQKIPPTLQWARSLLSQQTWRARDFGLLLLSALEKSLRQGKYKWLGYLLGMSEGKKEKKTQANVNVSITDPDLDLNYGLLALTAWADTQPGPPGAATQPEIPKSSEPGQHPAAGSLCPWKCGCLSPAPEIWGSSGTLPHPWPLSPLVRAPAHRPLPPPRKHFEQTHAEHTQIKTKPPVEVRSGAVTLCRSLWPVSSAWRALGSTAPGGLGRRLSGHPTFLDKPAQG